MVLGFSGAIFNGVSTALIIPVIFGFIGQEIGMKGMPPVLQQILSGSTNSLPPNHRYLIMMGWVLGAIVHVSLVEQGTPHELLKQGGLYADLYAVQFSNESGDEQSKPLENQTSLVGMN
jgi:hypothetical protein